MMHPNRRWPKEYAKPKIEIIVFDHKFPNGLTLGDWVLYKDYYVCLLSYIKSNNVNRGIIPKRIQITPYHIYQDIGAGEGKPINITEEEVLKLKKIRLYDYMRKLTDKHKLEFKRHLIDKE